MADGMAAGKAGGEWKVEGGGPPPLHAGFLYPADFPILIYGSKKLLLTPHIERATLSYEWKGKRHDNVND